MLDDELENWVYDLNGFEYPKSAESSKMVADRTVGRFNEQTEQEIDACWTTSLISGTASSGSVVRGPKSLICTN